MVVLSEAKGFLPKPDSIVKISASVLNNFFQAASGYVKFACLPQRANRWNDFHKGFQTAFEIIPHLSDQSLRGFIPLF